MWRVNLTLQLNIMLHTNVRLWYTRSLHHVSTTATPYWQVHQRSRLTSFKECSTLLLASLPVPISSTGASRGCCTPSCTGSTYLSESHTSSESSCSTASIVELHSIWSITVYRSPMWRHGSIFVQPVDVFWSYRVTVSALRSPGFCCDWPDGLELSSG